MYRLKIIESINTWEDFIKENSQSERDFLMSWHWGEFQKNYGRKILRIGILENDKLVGIMNVIAMDGRLGTKYAYIPYIKPKAKNEKRETQIINHILFQLKTLIKEHFGLTVFMKFDGFLSDKLQPAGQRDRVASYKTKSLQPPETVLIDLTKSEDEILQRMKPKHRYNIRVSYKKGVTIKISRSKDEITNFIRLLHITEKKDNFHGHTDQYYEQQIDTLQNNPKTFIFSAYYKRKCIASNIVFFYNKTATYLHGASDYQYRNLMAPYQLHWETIKYAKQKGHIIYDLWGINRKRKDWEGLNRFKLGFGGIPKEYGKSIEIPVKRFNYWIYKKAKRFFQILSLLE